MEVKEVTDKSLWESFLSSVSEKTFLNSWNWGEFQIVMGNKIWRRGVFNDEKLIALALISKIEARRGTFLLVQHGPAIVKREAHNAKQVLEILLEELKKIGKEEGAIFIRMNPLWERTQENQNILRELGFREAPMHANAYEATWRLDITIPEEELLKQMRKTTRYLIRQTMQNQEISVEKSEKFDDVEKYQKLNREVAQRQRFVPFSSEYIKNECKVFLKDSQAVLFLGKYKDEIASAALVIFWSGIGFYHQAASSSKYAKLSIPYLVMWEAIKEAKRRGCTLYDLWGYVDPEKQKRHPWAGPTLFKMGFGGFKKEYFKTQDLPLSSKYWLVYVFEKLRSFYRFSL